MSDEEKTCKDLIEALCGRFKADEAGDWEATVQFEFSGDKGGTFYVQIEDDACTMGEGTAEHASATVMTSDETWLGMAAGKVDPQAAFFSGDMKIKGNFADVMKINNKKIFPR